MSKCGEEKMKRKEKTKNNIYNTCTKTNLYIHTYMDIYIYIFKACVYTCF